MIAEINSDKLLDQSPYLIPILDYKAHSMYQQSLRLRRSIQEGDMSSIQILSDLKTQAHHLLDVVEIYLSQTDHQPSRPYLFAAETVLRNVVNSHPASNINEQWSSVPWKKETPAPVRKVVTGRQRNSQAGKSQNISISSSKASLTSCYNKQNTRLSLNKACASTEEKPKGRDLKSSQKRDRSISKSPIRNNPRNSGKEIQGDKGREEPWSLLTVRLSEEDYDQILRMKAAMGTKL